jgi:hypothetical protein
MSMPLPWSLSLFGMLSVEMCMVVSHMNMNMNTAYRHIDTDIETNRYGLAVSHVHVCVLAVSVSLSISVLCPCTYPSSCPHPCLCVNFTMLLVPRICSDPLLLAFWIWIHTKILQIQIRPVLQNIMCQVDNTKSYVRTIFPLGHR